MQATRGARLLAVLLALSLLAAACGDDSDDTTGGTTATEPAAGGGTSDGDSGGEQAGGEIDLDEELEVAPGTVLPLPDCPGDWDPEGGLTDDTITLAMSLPESGPVGYLGGLDDGMRAWFEQMEPIDGRRIELVSADDAYDPARALSNTQEFLTTNDPFALVYMIGTANGLAIRDLTADECIPQLFNSTGYQGFGDPEDYPWTIGGLLSYRTEAQLWCNYIRDEIGEGTTVAGLFMDNDFGLEYQEAIRSCADDGAIELVQEVTHDPAAPDVTDEITTIAASGAEVVVLGTTGAACPQSMAALAGSSYDPTILLSNTCEPLATYFSPIDPAGEGVIVAVQAKDPGSDADDPAVQESIAALEAANLDPFAGAFFTGTIFARSIEVVLRAAAEMDGGLNRVNVMRTVWNADLEHPLLVDGSVLKTDGSNDAYLIEAARMSRYVPPAAGEELGHWEPLSDVISLEGEAGSYEG